jgi:hypothetical protein
MIREKHQQPQQQQQQPQLKTLTKVFASIWARLLTSQKGSSARLMQLQLGTFLGA